MVCVETFECSETAAEPIEASEEAIAILESMQLEGQLSLVRPKGDLPGTRCPYREITVEENFAYRVLCPNKTLAKRYSASPIPLRVLQVLSHAESLKRFGRFEIWDRASMAEKDPVLVAHTSDNEWSSTSKCFILARWGAELETFATILKRAVAAKKEQLVDGVNAVKARVDVEVGRVMGMTSQQIIEAGPDAQVELRVPGAR